MTLSPQEWITWVETHVERFGQSAFRLTAPDGRILYLDLFEPPEKLIPADIVLITHEHHDHFHPDVVRSVLGPGTRVVMPASMKADGTDHGLATDLIVPGGNLDLGILKVSAVRAYNVSAPFHPREKDWVGYRFEWDGVQVYHAGDTDLIPEMEGLNVDLALIPVGGGFTMGWQDAVQAAALWTPGVVVPMHYGKVPMTGEAGRNFARAYPGLSVLLEQS